MKGYKNISNNAKKSNTEKNSKHSSHSNSSSFHRSEQNVKEQRNKLIQKYTNLMK
jgi:hypothetical protein